MSNHKSHGRDIRKTPPNLLCFFSMKELWVGEGRMQAVQESQGAAGGRGSHQIYIISDVWNLRPRLSPKFRKA